MFSVSWGRKIIFVLLFLVIPISGLFAQETTVDYGIISLLPPLVAILLCLLTREVLPSLFVGIWVAATILTGGNPISGFGKSVEALWNSLGDPWGAKIVLTSLTMGGIIGVMWVGGGLEAMINFITSKVKSRRSAMIATEAAGFLVFYEDYVNTLVVGTSMSPITGKFRISKEKLSYIVDSTAAPIACIALISSWITFLAGQIEKQFAELGIELSGYSAFLNSIPYVLYSFAALGVLTLVVISGRDFGPMLKAERRAINEGKILREGAHPLQGSNDASDLKAEEQVPRRLVNFFAPIITLIASIFILMMVTGGWPEKSIAASIADASTSNALCWGSFFTLFFTIILYMVQRLATMERLFRGFMDGVRSIVLGALILVFAWGIGSMIKEVGTARYIIGVVGDSLSSGFIPVIAFVLAGVISFSTGTSYGTISIVLPIVLPLSYAMSVSGGDDVMRNIFASIGAIFAGSVFGDHCSPISDTTIMSSMFTGSDHIDHVTSQIPYATLAGMGAFVGFILIGFGVPLVLAFALTVLLPLAAFWFLSKPVIER